MCNLKQEIFVEVVGVLQNIIYKLILGKVQSICKLIEIVVVLGVLLVWLQIGEGVLVVCSVVFVVDGSLLVLELLYLWDSDILLDEDEVELLLYKEVEMFVGVGCIVVCEIEGCKLCFFYVMLCVLGVDLLVVICV